MDAIATFGPAEAPASARVRMEAVNAPRRPGLIRALRTLNNRVEQWGRDALMAHVLRGLARGPEAFAAAVARARALNLRFDRDVLPKVAAEAVPVPPPAGCPAGEGPSCWFEPKGGEPRGLLFHVHGGGFICTRSPRVNKLVARFAAAAGSAVYAPSHRLAPEHPAPAAADDVAAAFRWLTAHGPALPVVALAESSGAAVLLAALHGLRDEGHPLPRAVVLLSRSWT